MKTYKFNLDKLTHVWVREFHEVQASTIEEAESIILKLNEEGKTDISFVYQEMLDETISEDAGCEIMNDETGETIFSNIF